MNNIPNDIPKYRKKSTARPPAKAKHKHVYTACLLEYPTDWWNKPHERKRYVPHLQFASYCPECGKISEHDRKRWFVTVEKTFENGRKYYESVFTEEAKRELNPSTRTLPLFKVGGPFTRTVEIGGNEHEPDKSV